MPVPTDDEHLPDASTLEELTRAYAFDTPVALTPFGSGRIHHTYHLDAAGELWLLQQLNTQVFTDPLALAHNLRLVAAHLAKLPTGYRADGRPRPVLTLRPTVGGQPLHQSADGRWWRVYRFIGGTVPGAPTDLAQVRDAAERYGEFLRALASLSPGSLVETIPHFHDTARRYRALGEALRADPCGRAQACAPTIAFAEQRAPLADLLERLRRQGEVPERVVHNDCKLDNVLFDEATGEALCVVDLDTVMAGLAWHDVGDLIRSAAASGGEDQEGLVLDRNRFEAVVRGYLAGTGDLLTAFEVEHLPMAGQSITYELGLRFLTDHLTGDRYFRVAAPGDNLRRAERQFALLESMERQMDVLQCIVSASAQEAGGS